MRIGLFFILTFIILPCLAQAGEPLLFRDGPRDIRERQVIGALAAQGKLDPAKPYRLAAIDLNGDGVAEWLVRQEQTPGCAANADCHHFIIGLRGGAPTLLAAIDARKIGIADEKSYGVRQLIVYNQPYDDFAGLLYRWNPLTSSFSPR